jgi:hypothetical protein
VSQGGKTDNEGERETAPELRKQQRVRDEAVIGDNKAAGAGNFPISLKGQ